MKLTRKNYKLLAIVGLLLAAGATSVVMADDKANAAGKGVDLRPPVACGKQIPTDISSLPPTTSITSITSITSDLFSYITTFTAPGTYTVTVPPISASLSTTLSTTFSVDPTLPTTFTRTFLTTTSAFTDIARDLRKAFAHDGQTEEGCS